MIAPFIPLVVPTLRRITPSFTSLKRGRADAARAAAMVAAAATAAGDASAALHASAGDAATGAPKRERSEERSAVAQKRQRAGGRFTASTIEWVSIAEEEEKEKEKEAK